MTNNDAKNNTNNNESSIIQSWDDNDEVNDVDDDDNDTVNGKQRGLGLSWSQLTFQPLLLFFGIKFDGFFCSIDDDDFVDDDANSDDVDDFGIGNKFGTNDGLVTW